MSKMENIAPSLEGSAIDRAKNGWEEISNEEKSILSSAIISPGHTPPSFLTAIALIMTLSSNPQENRMDFLKAQLCVPSISTEEKNQIKRELSQNPNLIQSIVMGLIQTETGNKGALSHIIKTHLASNTSETGTIPQQIRPALISLLKEGV